MEGGNGIKREQVDKKKSFEETSDDSVQCELRVMIKLILRIWVSTKQES